MYILKQGQKGILNREKFQEIEDRGFFIGLPTNDMSYKTLNFLTEKLLKIKDY